MNYELAKQLKDVGYPQEAAKGSFLSGTWFEREKTYIPTLEELIDACGLKTFRLESWKEGWKAGDYTSRSMKKYALGKTPTEAVARLWLEINK